MTRVFILPYKKGSKSVSHLYAHLNMDVKMIKLEGSKYKNKETDVVINWGNSTSDLTFSRESILNHPDDVAFASNKVNFFRTVSDFNVDEKDRPRTPQWTQDKEEVRSWLVDGRVVFARTKLTGHSGEGIEVLDNVGQEEKYKTNTLFTRYEKKKDEYRLHFFQGKIFDVQRKARRTEEADPNWMIRSHKNGFIYSRNNVGDVPNSVTTEALKTVNLLPLDFGAIDVIYNKLHDQAYVLEVNTAPGLEGTTLENYARQFQSFVENRT